MTEEPVTGEHDSLSNTDWSGRRCCLLVLSSVVGHVLLHRSSVSIWMPSGRRCRVARGGTCQTTEGGLRTITPPSPPHLVRSCVPVQRGECPAVGLPLLRVEQFAGAVTGHQQTHEQHRQRDRRNHRYPPRVPPVRDVVAFEPARYRLAQRDGHRLGVSQAEKGQCGLVQHVQRDQ